MIAVELLLDARATIGESPIWNPAQQMLFWIDVKAPALHRTDPESGVSRTWPLPDEIGCHAIDAAGSHALLGLRNGLFRLDLHDARLEKIAEPPFDPATHRFNEGGCDVTGRFWLGTMFDPRPGVSVPETPGLLYSYRPDEGLRSYPDFALLVNGMAWSEDAGTMFLAHSRQQQVRAYPFDAAAGQLGEGRVFIEIPKELGLPDGAAMDTEGGYWLAIHRGSRVRRYLPDGRVDQEVSLPVKCPTMCAFTGPTLETMIITSATHGQEPPPAGGLFRCRPGVRGRVLPTPQ